MALESGTYIDSLNASNPASTDALSAADDHLRLIKSTVKATLPNVTGAVTATHTELNLIDGVTATTAELNILDGVTATAAELNILDGVTATASELNLVDGVTATTAELNYVDGVTSAIQTQLDAKQASNDILTDIAGLTQATNKVPYFSSATAASLLDFKDEDDMSSNSAGAVPSQQSVKAYVDAVVSVGVGQTWARYSRTTGTNYTNGTSKPIMVSAFVYGGGMTISVGADTSNYVVIATWPNENGEFEKSNYSFIVPAGHVYKFTGTASDLTYVSELR
jgi:hypothetical protein